MGDAGRSRGFGSAAFVMAAVCAIGADRAAAEPIACQQAIARASATYVQARAKSLLGCEQDKVKGRLAPQVDCTTEAKVAPKLTAAGAKLQDDIARACGGSDRTCGTPGDDPISALGWPAQCPNLESGACDDPIAHCGDIAACLVCLDSAAVDQAMELYHGSLVGGTTGDPALNRCQQEIGRAAAKFLQAKSKALRTCWDQRLTGKHADVCPNPSAGPTTPAGRAAAAIAKAERKKIASICRACGGDDRECGGGDDLTPAAIGFVPSCTDVTVPGGPECGALTAIDELGELLQCVDCVTEFKVDCVDRAAVPALAPYPEECGPTFPPGTADDITCQRAIAKASSLYARDRAKALSGCELSKLKGQLAPGTDCDAEPKTVDRIARSAGKLERDLARACGGDDGTCGTEDDSSLGSIGWPNRCPRFSGLCDAPLGGCDDVAACLICVGDAGVDQALGVAYGDLLPGQDDVGLGRCQQAIGKATTDFVRAKSKALQTCWDARLRGRHDDVCPSATAAPTSPAGKAAAAIAKAEARKIETICRACGGSDRDCGGGDDLALAQIGFAASCVDVSVPGGADCGDITPIHTLGELVQCVDCAAEFDVDCIDRAAVPALASFSSAMSRDRRPDADPDADPDGDAAGHADADRDRSAAAVHEPDDPDRYVVRAAGRRSGLGSDGAAQLPGEPGDHSGVG